MVSQQQFQHLSEGPAWPHAQQEMAGARWCLSEPIHQSGWLFPGKRPAFCFRVLLGNGMDFTADHNTKRKHPFLL